MDSSESGKSAANVVEMSAIKVEANSDHGLVSIQLPVKQQQHTRSGLANRVNSAPRSDSVSFARIIERNVIYVWEQFKQFIDGRTRNKNRNIFAPIICGAIIIFYLFYSLVESKQTITTANGNGVPVQIELIDGAYSPLVATLTFTPGSILTPRHWLWSALATLTYPLIELHLWQVVLDVIVVAMSSTLIEPLWSQKEMASFFVIINVFVAFFTTAHYIVLYSLYSDIKYLYGVRIYGLSGYCAAICVTVKQLLPESVLISTSLGKLKNNNVPLTAFIVGIILYLFNLIEGVLVVKFFYGLIISWIYLRFFQLHHSNGHRGDLSESFAFATFFPNVMRPIIAIICNTIYEFFVKIRLCPQISRQYQSVRVLSERLTQEHSNATGGSSNNSSISLPPVRGQFKHHQSGDYQHLHQPQVQAL
ncbi:transmembrane protein 115-like protein [Dinothrombium tinctorium]|uniref:Transmembrane protein 115-like protein n=1 Tax=Dinothrombium tinctorium TaxID=1965070 RepID=A0A3S4QER3_9ACAR|nr:transmembrane protein 115-like protein [Dinothrombium tinctorium]